MEKSKVFILAKSRLEVVAVLMSRPREEQFKALVIVTADHCIEQTVIRLLHRGFLMNLSELLKMYDFTGRTIVITGATGVLCGAMAKALVGCGANVAILARSREKGEATLDGISGPGRAMVVVGDALKQEALRDAARAALDEFGRIDGLINGAGGNIPQATTRQDLSFFDLPEDALRHVLDLNLL